ncbi:hypothetical protein [Aurantiacibacter spongiae]|uniref:hypothetical protein n=1 Tax=Aurantiacibacter spongiae TaxID=2488860 RepID=UPI0013150992|nr:hypothetical protein [Aurantiacibacter spongiae]
MIRRIIHTIAAVDDDTWRGECRLAVSVVVVLVAVANAPRIVAAAPFLWEALL